MKAICQAYYFELTVSTGERAGKTIQYKNFSHFFYFWTRRNKTRIYILFIFTIVLQGRWNNWWTSPMVNIFWTIVINFGERLIHHAVQGLTDAKTSYISHFHWLWTRLDRVCLSPFMSSFVNWSIIVIQIEFTTLISIFDTSPRVTFGHRPNSGTSGT